MTSKRHQADNTLAQWIEMVGASVDARRCNLPKDRPVYRI
jgi:hypothetical protein